MTIGKMMLKLFGMNPQVATGVLAILLVVVVAGGVVANIEITSTNIHLRMRNIGELATQSAYTTNVQTISKWRELFDWEGWEIPFTRNEYIFSYDCEVKAGLDFEDIEIQVDHAKKRIDVKMPETRVLSVAIDPGSLRIYDEERSAFTPLTLSDMNQSLVAIEKQAEETAVNNGILAEAQEHAQVLIKAFVTGILEDKDVNTYTFAFEIVPTRGEMDE